MGAGLLIGGLVVGGAVLTGHGDDLLAFGQKALGKLGEILQGLFGNEYVPDKDPTGTHEATVETAESFVNGHQIKTNDEIETDIYGTYAMEKNIENAVTQSFEKFNGKNIGDVQNFFGDTFVGDIFSIENEDEFDARNIALELAQKGGITVMDGDTMKSVEDSAKELQPYIFNAIKNHPDDKAGIIKEVTDVISGKMDDTEHQANFVISAERAVMGNDTYNAVYNAYQKQNVKMPWMKDRTEIHDDIVNSLIDKRGLLEGKTEEETRKELDSMVWDAMLRDDNPMRIAGDITTNLSVRGLTFEKQTEIIENFKQGKALESDGMEDVGDKQVSNSLAEGMTAPSEGGQPTSVEQATAGVEVKQWKNQENKGKEVTEIEK